MDAPKLTYFLAAAQTLNFRKAAALCHVAQPVLSRQIAVLEGELGVALFTRDSRRIALTAAGEGFVEHARAILAAINQGRQAMAAQVHAEGGTLTVGCIEPLADTLLPPAFAIFQRQYPHTRVAVTVSGTEELFGMVEDEQLEIGLFGLAPERVQPKPLMVVQKIYHDRLALFIAPGHPFHDGRASVELAQIFDERLALLKENFAMRRILKRIFAVSSHALAPALEIDNVATLKQIVQQGGISTVLPASLLAASDRQAGVVALPIAGLDELFTFALVYRQSASLSPIAQAFIQAVLASAAQQQRAYQPGT